jgi:hypothetical protein
MAFSAFPVWACSATMRPLPGELEVFSRRRVLPAGSEQTELLEPA